ncbi:MAG: sugar isomerase, partial [Actinomycetota bacterium]|nr:sugar isomerase [Actinomycetota bacterium]
MAAQSFVAAEIASQPECWQRAVETTKDSAPAFPTAGESVAVVGCGTSWFMAMAYAGLREAGGHGRTDAFAASEVPLGRTYDRVLAISRSGTTTEVVDLLAAFAGRVPTTAITGVAGTPVTTIADATVVLDFADEHSVVQTRFATTALASLRASLGEDLTTPIADAAVAMGLPLAT